VQLVVAGLMIASGAVPAGRALNVGLAGLSSIPGSSTWHPRCDQLVIRRQGHGVSYTGLLGRRQRSGRLG
jgi:hypothetical protein